MSVAVQGSRYMTLEPVALLSDDPTDSLPTGELSVPALPEFTMAKPSSYTTGWRMIRV